LLAGSYTEPAEKASAFRDVGAKGLPPPKTYSFPPAIAPPATLAAVGRFARAVQVFAPMS